MRILAAAAVALWLAPSSELETALTRLDRYMDGYETKLSELIADEVMIQEVLRNRVTASGIEIEPGVRVTKDRRRLTSEVAFVSLPADAGWLGFRHVKAVNDRTLTQPEQSLSSALQKSSYEAARSMVNESAAHNLGLPRTTNLPNLPLEFLHQRNRKRFVARVDGRERVRGISVVRIVLIERMTPTLIRTPDGRDMPSVVRAWVGINDGRLMRAEVRTATSPESREFPNSIRVEFTENKALGLMVPSEMHEVFPSNGVIRGKSVATYTNYRRFQTSARIVPQ